MRSTLGWRREIGDGSWLPLVGHWLQRVERGELVVKNDTRFANDLGKTKIKKNFLFSMKLVSEHFNIIEN